MASLAAWCGTPSVTNTCLLTIMPGVYNIGSNYILIPQYVDVAGSGPAVTKIQGLDTVEFVNEGGKEWYHGIVRMNGGNLRDITIEALGALYDDPYAIEVRESAKIENVTAISREGGSPIYVWTQGSGQNPQPQLVGKDVEMNNVTVLVPTPTECTYGIEVNRTESLVIRDSKVEIGECAGCTCGGGITVSTTNGISAIHDTSVTAPVYGFAKGTVGANVVGLFDMTVAAPYPLVGTGFKCYDVVDGALDPVSCQ
ncbi:MAG: hypothetical protein ACM34I_01400 [bacterium]